MSFLVSIVAVISILFSACSSPAVKEPPAPEKVVKVHKRTNHSSGTQTGTSTDTSTSVSEETQNEIDDDDFDQEIDHESWKLISDEEGIQTYQKADQSTDRISFRGETIVPTSLLRIATVLNNPELRKKWIDSFVEAHLIRDISKVERVEYNHTKVPWPFEDRDFVYNMKAKIALKPKAMLVSMKSVTDPKEPPHEGIVRGEIIYSYYFMKELSAGRSTKVVVEMAVDPKGVIPKWLVAISQQRWPHNTLKNMKNIAVKTDFVVTKEIEEYFKTRGRKK